MEDNSDNNNNRGMSDGCYACMILSIIGGTIILAIAAFAMICFGAASSFIWPGLGVAILYPGICYINQGDTDDIPRGIFLLACGITALLLGIFNVTFILQFNLILGSCLGSSLILSGLFCVSDYVFKRKEYKDNEIFYHRYMYISGFITASTCTFLVGFGVVPFATVAPLAGPFICVSLCFFLYRLVCFIQNYLQKKRIEVPDPNGQNLSIKPENEINKDSPTPDLENNKEQKITMN